MKSARHWARAVSLCLLIARGTASAASPTPTQEPPSCPPPPPAALTAQQVQEGMAQAQDRGFLWRLTKDGHRSYLYGTIHMARREWALPGPKTLEALREIDTVALEVDPLDPKVRQALAPGSGRAPATTTEIPAALQERIERRIAFECLSPGTFEKLPPELKVMALTLLAGRRDGLEIGYAIDAVLAGFARAAHKTIVSLETTDVQLAARRAMSDGAKAASLEKTLDELESGRVAAVLNRLAEMWAASDFAALKQYEQRLNDSDSETERALAKQVIDNRNLGLATRIDALHGSGSKVFAAVGFMHMIGPASLPGLLAAKGYQVEAISFRR